MGKKKKKWWKTYFFHLHFVVFPGMGWLA